MQSYVNLKNIFCQNLMTSKSWLARNNLSVPRLKLGAAFVSANLAENVKTFLIKLNVRKMYTWSDSPTVLNWLNENGEYKLFVSNRMSKLKGKGFIESKHVPTKENPANLGGIG